MNLKYYLRGLGLGIVITAIIMGIATKGRKEVLTDEEIITRAESLGMVEDIILTDSVADARKETEEKVREEVSAQYTAEIEQLKLQIEQYEALATQEAMSEAAEEEPEPVIFTVMKGEMPISIAERMEQEGLISEAEEFDKFLVDNGYDRRIVAAEYEIPGNADMETIAEMITKKRAGAEAAETEAAVPETAEAGTEVVE